MAQPGLTSFEPAFIDELSTILVWSFDHMQKHGHGESPQQNWLNDDHGGSVYLRLSTRPLEQPKRTLDDGLKRDIIDGAYWMRRPGPNCEVVVIYQGVVASEALEAVGLMAEDRRDVGLLAVTSADRLHAGWTAASRAREGGLVHARAHIERLIAAVPRNCALVTVLDGHPATLGWLGAVAGHRVRALGVEQFGQTGSIADLYRHYGIDTNAIIVASQAVAEGRPIRHLKLA
jgi:pyruvate dehydrogenase E1 component